MNAAIMKKTPFEAWIAKKMGVGRDTFTRDDLRQYQLQKLRETIRLAYRHSPFYRKLLKGCAETELTCLEDLRRLPFTTAENLREHALQILCVSQDDINRVVTLDSSGTTGQAKRIYFTASDQELTIDYFQYGMAALTEKGDRVLILFPGERPGSLGDLLATALHRLGVEPIPHGIVRNIPAVLEIMARDKVDCLVGIPTQLLALARYADNASMPIKVKSVLFGSDHAPNAIIQELRRIWGCQVFDHYGMTEMGLGGGTECTAQSGYHLHEADLYFEIVDPLTGEAVPEGQEGEVVVTTLTRQGMPLIRYRTDDISRFLTKPCRCGSHLWRLEKLTGRKNKQISLTENQQFTMFDLDEALFVVDKVVDFTAAVDNTRSATKLAVSAVMVGQPDKGMEHTLSAALDAVPAIRWARRAGKLAVSVKTVCCEDNLAPKAAKRAIVELNETDGKPDNIFDKAWKNSTGR